MSSRNVSMGAPFRWIMKALDAGRRNPTAVFGGFLLLLVVGLVPTAVQLAADAMLAQRSAPWLAVYLLSVIASGILLPPLIGAAFRLLDACERGLPVRASAIFDGYRLPGFATRMILLALAFVGVYLAVLGVLYVLLPGKEIFAEFLQRAAAAPPGGQPDFSGIAAPPGGAFLWLLGAIFLLVILGNAYMLAFAQAALGGRGIGQAVADGFKGAFRNLLPFLGFAIAVFFVGIVLMLMLTLVLGLLVFVLSLASTALAVAVAVPIYLVLVLGLYVLMFAFYYHAWREIFGVAAPAADDDATLVA